MGILLDVVRVAGICACVACASVSFDARAAGDTEIVETRVLRLVKAHSQVVTASGPFASVAVGSPAIARTTALSSTRVLVNAVAPGTTSLMLLLRNGRMEQYRVVVVHDLTHLQRHLSGLDARIRVESDPNGDAVILSGVAASKAVVERAAEAAYRFFGRACARRCRRARRASSTCWSPRTSSPPQRGGSNPC